MCVFDIAKYVFYLFNHSLVMGRSPVINLFHQNIEGISNFNLQKGFFCVLHPMNRTLWTFVGLSPCPLYSELILTHSLNQSRNSSSSFLGDVPVLFLQFLQFLFVRFAFLCVYVLMLGFSVLVLSFLSYLIWNISSTLSSSPLKLLIV